jgi:Ca-activated chloride channel family protein
MKTVLSILILFFIGINLPAQPVNQSIKTGNDLYRKMKYDEAATYYSKAIKLEPANYSAKFNLGNTLYRQGKEEDAISTLSLITVDVRETGMRSKAYYNKGVVLTSQKKLEESIEAYKNALRQQPNDQEARENLQKALLELKKKEPPKEQDKKKNKEQQQQPQKQPKMNRQEAEQRLKLLEQKEKEVHQRIQNEKSKTGGGLQKDW